MSFALSNSYLLRIFIFSNVVKGSIEMKIISPLSHALPYISWRDDEFQWDSSEDKCFWLVNHSETSWSCSGLQLEESKTVYISISVLSTSGGNCTVEIQSSGSGMGAPVRGEGSMKKATCDWLSSCLSIPMVSETKVLSRIKGWIHWELQTFISCRLVWVMTMMVWHFCERDVHKVVIINCTHCHVTFQLLSLRFSLLNTNLERREMMSQTAMDLMCTMPSSVRVWANFGFLIPCWLCHLLLSHRSFSSLDHNLFISHHNFSSVFRNWPSSFLRLHGSLMI